MKIIKVKECMTCPKNGKCSAWEKLTGAQKITLCISHSVPNDFILKDCPLEDDPSKWTNGIPPVGMTVNYNDIPWIVIGTTINYLSKKIHCSNLVHIHDSTEVTNATFDIRELKPWEE